MDYCHLHNIAKLGKNKNKNATLHHRGPLLASDTYCEKLFSFFNLFLSLVLMEELVTEAVLVQQRLSPPKCTIQACTGLHCWNQWCWPQQGEPTFPKTSKQTSYIRSLINHYNCLHLIDHIIDHGLELYQLCLLIHIVDTQCVIHINLFMGNSQFIYLLF